MLQILSINIPNYHENEWLTIFELQREKNQSVGNMNEENCPKF